MRLVNTALTQYPYGKSVSGWVGEWWYRTKKATEEKFRIREDILLQYLTATLASVAENEE